MGSQPTRIFDFYQLEDRVLLSGDSLDGAELGLEGDPALVDALMADLAADGEAAPNAPRAESDALLTEAADIRDSSTLDPALPIEVVFVDAAVEDADVLINGLRDSASEPIQWIVIELDGQRDGIDQITSALARLSGVDAIHLVSHGDGEGIYLGNTRLDLNSMEAYASQVATWASSMDVDADLLLYGCDLASTEEGRTLIELLSTLTACDVAASDDATGHESLGGDWDFEYIVGSVSTEVAFHDAARSSWFSLLATATFQQGDANGYSGTQDTEIRSNDASNSFGGSSTVSIDLDNGSGGISQGLIRFDSLFGTGPGQIPLNAIITSASLTVDVTSDSSNTISLHRMLTNWSESSTWNSLSGGLSANDIEMSVIADSQLVAPGTGSVTFTGLGKTIQRWASGDTNYGWGLLNNGTDGLDFRSSESGGTRPLLTVDYVLPGTQASTVHVLTVDTTSDVHDGDVSSIDALLANKGADGLISLREAILAANATTNDVSGPDQIQFNLSTSDPGYVDPDATPGNGDEYWTISPDYFLGYLYDPVIIDATTQTGYNPGDGDPVIEIDATGMSTGTAILALRTNNSTIRGFSVFGSPDEGIEIDGSTGFGDNNTIAGNWVGIDAEGNVVNNAQHGIMVSVDADNNTIGGTGANDGNVIGGTLAGYASLMFESDSDNNLVQGNLIGVKSDGITSSGNLGKGILIQLSSDGNQIGGTTSAERNIISGNGGHGIDVDGTTNGTYTTNVTGTIIQGNYIGLDATGTTIVANGGSGIRLYLTNNNQIGGTVAGAGNVISGNIQDGILLDNADSNLVQGNLIGTDATGTLDRGNGNDGIEITNGSTGNLIGGAVAAARNIVSGQSNEGIYLQGASTTGNFILGNYIGTEITGTLALANGGSGIRTWNAGANTIGGEAEGEGNVVAFNGEAGIDVEGSSTGITIRGNTIHSNASLGIDLNADGATTNDSNDADSGPNGRQNYADLTKAVVDGNRITISGTINSIASTPFVIDFFASGAPGEARTYLGSTTVSTNATNDGSFRAVFDKTVSAGQYITATATNTVTGNTSELSASLQTVTETGGLWLSTSSDVASSGANGLDTWTEGEAIEFGGTSMTLGPATTSGSFSTLFNLDDFALDGNVQLHSMDVVSRTINLGTTNRVTLYAGDVLFSVKDAETFDGLIVNKEDVLLFRPDAPGDYSSGTISILLDNPLGAEIRGVSLVEETVIVGDVEIHKGEFLFVRSGGMEDSDIYLFTPDDVGVGTSGTVRKLLNGEDIGLDVQLRGVDLVQHDMTLGGQSLTAGQLLVSISGLDASVGTNGLANADGQDVIVLDVLTTTLASDRSQTGTTTANASFLLDGNGNAFLDTANEKIDAIALHVNTPPDAQDDRAALTFDGDDYITMGSDASLVMTTNMTVEAWVRPVAGGSGTQIILNKEGEYELGITAETGELKWAIANTNPGWTWYNTGHYLHFRPVEPHRIYL